MHDFDEYLETELRHMLDPVVATPAPKRTGRRIAVKPTILAVDAPVDLAAQANAVVQPVAVAIQPLAPPL